MYILLDLRGVDPVSDNVGTNDIFTAKAQRLSGKEKNLTAHNSLRKYLLGGVAFTCSRCEISIERVPLAL